MSLVNDALKRAKQVPTQKAPELPGAPTAHDLVEDDASTRARHGLGLALQVTFVVVGLLALLLAWQFAHRGSSPASDSQEMVVRASGPATTLSLPAPTPAPVPAPETGPTPAPAKAVLPAKVPEILTAAAANPAPQTNPVVVAVAPAPKVPKLQGVIWHPTRPSVVIDGQSMFVGDQLDDYRLATVTPQSATLSCPGKTNLVLRLTR